MRYNSKASFLTHTTGSYMSKKKPVGEEKTEIDK